MTLTRWMGWAATRPGPVRHEALASIVRHGTALGDTYPSIWDPWDIIQPSLKLTLEQAAVPLAKSVEQRHRFSFVAGVVAILFAMVAAIVIAANLRWLPGSHFLIVLAALWWIQAFASRRAARLKAAHELAMRLVHEGTDAACKAVIARRVAAMNHEPDPAIPFTPAGPLPEPAEYGVSHEGAERLVASWMRYLGEADASVTRFTSDGGIDVTSLHYIAQVKNYSGSVGVAEVRELQGVASVDGRKPLFFTSGVYAAGAIAFADQVGMALFQYRAEEGTLLSCNARAQQLLRTGLN